MSDDTEWPNNVWTSPGARSVWIGAPNRRPLRDRLADQSAITRSGVRASLSAGREPRRVAGPCREAGAVGAYAWVRLVSLDFHDTGTGEQVTLGVR